MERINKRRARIILVLFCLVVSFFAFRLYDIQIIQTGGNTDNTSTFTTRTRVKAARGDILDRNGNILVSNRPSYDLVINHYVLISADGTNNYLYQLVVRCQEVGIEFTEHLPISETRPFEYTLEEYNSSWQSAFQTFLVETANLDSDITAPLLMERLRSFYRIPEDWPDDIARKVVGLRYELSLRNCVPSLPNYVFMTDASDEALAAIVELNIPGLTVEQSTVREYNTTYAAHVLGYVGAMSPAQWQYYKTVEGYAMDAEVGQSGLEQAYEEYLHGVDGLREDVVARDGTLVSSRYLQEPKAGANVEVSIDINLQMAAEDKLASVMEALRETDGDGHDAEGGAVVAIDTRTGQVLVCASYPTYDPATMFEDWNTLLDTPFGPLFNRALQGRYPPGSTYKMSMVIAGINNGYITSSTQIVDKGVYTKYAPSLRVACLQWTSRHTTHGPLTPMEALQKSCNYFFYELGDRINLSAMDATAKGLGLGEYTGVELPEALGHRANAESKAQVNAGTNNTAWYAGDKVLAAIGQSVNSFTPIQLCSYTSALANRGIRYKATFLSRVVASDYRSLLLENQKEVMSQMDISDDAYYAYTTGMYMVANEVGGTAYSTFKDYPITVAAKTGTAQTGQTGSDNGAFVCYAPFNDPQIAIAVYGEKAGHGSTIAGVAKAVLDIYFEVGEIGDVNTYENRPS